MIERASWGYAANDDAMRLRCRNAPVEIRLNIDANREARGLRPLWPGIERRAIATRAKAAATARRLRAFIVMQGYAVSAATK